MSETTDLVRRSADLAHRPEGLMLSTLMQAPEGYEVAEVLGSTAEVVRSKVSAGEIPAYRWGKNFRYFRDEVLDWLREQAVQTPSKEAVAG